MPTERNARVLADLAVLANVVARLDAIDVPVAHAQVISNTLPIINLDLAHFRTHFQGCDATVKHDGSVDEYSIERDGVTYRATDYYPAHAPARVETIRLPGDLAAK